MDATDSHLPPVDEVIVSTLELFGVAMLVAIVARRFKLPYTVGLVLAGAALAWLPLDLGVHLTHDVIFDVILPPLLFEAALAIDWRELARELPLVLSFATFGVVACAGVVSAGLIYVLGWPLWPSLAFGSLVGATDPIAVIALLRENKVKGRLALTIEAESLMNDGVAALLFTLVAPALVPGGHAPGLAEIGAQALVIGAGGLAVGAAVGLAAVALAGSTSDHLVETAISTVAAYGSFLVAERVGASGVLACVAAGLVMGNLGVLAPKESTFALSNLGRTFVVEFWEFAAFLSNSAVFLLIGLALAGQRPHSWDVFAFIVALALAGRAATVYPISLAFSRSRWRLEGAAQHFLWWSGLRGALALALALALPPEAEYRDHLLAATFGVVAFSILVQGLSAGWVFKALGLASVPPARS